MTQQKTGNSIPSTAPARFVPQQNPQNLANTVRKATFTLFMFFLFCAAYAQNISIISPTGAYYCGSVVTLESSITPTFGNSIAWVSTGGITLRALGNTGNGLNVHSSNTSNRVEAIVNGAGTVRMIIGVQTTIITLTPSPATLNSVGFSATGGGIRLPNGIQTTKGWICLSNNGSTETITLTNLSPLNIFWVVSGGAVKVSETQSSGTSPFTASVTIATSGAGAGKGSIRAFVSDPCGTLTCDPALDIEILKDLVPSEIAGPTCLRNNNLVYNANIGTVVYSITDEFAGNAIYNWELLQGGVPVTNPNFRIRSQVLYGNSATIEYEGVLPSAIGNFSLRVTNSCGGSFTRDITVSPAIPVPSQLTYCVSNVPGTQQTITLPTLLAGQTYSVTPQGSVNWTVSVSGNQATITFHDAVGGTVEVKAGSSSDPSCTSEGTLIYFNRESTTAPTITGPTCITRNTTDAFSFTASPFGQYTWLISPALPAGFVTSSGGNVFTVSPPAGGINISGNYTVTAILAGCSSSQAATFPFEIGPARPTITGETCLTPGTNYSYTVTSAGAAYYIATVNRTTTSAPFPIGSPFVFTALDQDARISITSYSATGCASLPTVFEVKAKPKVISITSTDLCVNFNETPTITYTAVASGAVTEFNWTSPWGADIDGDLTNNTATYRLDNTTAGNVCVTPKNGTCVGNAFCLNVPRNALAITLLRSEIPAFTFGNPFPILVLKASSSTGTPLVMNFYFGKTRTGIDGVIQVVGGQEQATGTPFLNPLNTTAGLDAFYSVVMPPGQGINSLLNPWISLSIEDPSTGCSRAVAVEVKTIPNVAPGGNYKIATNQMKANFEINAYPNPTDNVLNVKIPTDIKVIQTYLVDTKGNIVFQSSQSLNNQKIDVSKFAKGMYFLGILTDKGIQGKKIIIE